MLKHLALTIATLLPTFALAENLVVESKPRIFTMAKVSASKVKGVNIRLSSTITRTDCNSRTINFDLTVVDGNKDFAWHQTAFANASTFHTDLGCPLEKPVTEVIYSEPVTVNSLNNRNADGEVLLNIIVPGGYAVEATEIQK